MAKTTDDFSVYHEGDILVYSGDDERFDGQVLVLRNIEPWDFSGQDVWNTMDAMQGVFTEEYLSEKYTLIGNMNEMDATDVSDDD